MILFCRIGVCSERTNRANRVHDVSSKSHAIFNKQSTDVRRHRCILLVVLRVMRRIVLLGRLEEEQDQGL
jgi:hypothetical protein